MFSKLAHIALSRAPENFRDFLRRRLNPNYPPESMNGLYRKENSEDDIDKWDIGRLFLNHDGHETVKWSQYLEAYDRFLGPRRYGILEGGGMRRPTRLLEIGVREGGSLQIFQEFFGSNGQIVGIDIDNRCRKIEVSPAQIRIGDQSDREFLLSVTREFGTPDIVIDDGSHLPKHQMASFETLWQQLNPGGIYIVEDLHTSYWREFGGGYGKKAGFIEFVKDAIDGMHMWYSRHKMTERGAFAKTEVKAITVFDSLVIFEKTLGRRPESLRFGKPRTFR